MKRTGFLFEKVTSQENLLTSYKKARSGTLKTSAVCRFGFLLEHELIQLRDELLSRCYFPKPYRYFTIKDPKRRTIAVAHFRDRVVHHAVVGVLEPVLEQSFIEQSYATRKDKGAHKAVFKAQNYLRRNTWFLKMDIASFFDSIQHGILLEQLNRKIKDPSLIDLLEVIVTNNHREPQGLPIGNLTSQFLANVYLNGFDHWVKETLGAQYYIRYMDDMVFFHQDKSILKNWHHAVEGFLKQHLSLQLKPSATFLNQASNGLGFLGTRIFPEIIRLHPINARRAHRKLADKTSAFLSGVLSEKEFIQSINSYQSYLSVYGTHGLRKHIYQNNGLTA